MEDELRAIMILLTAGIISSLLGAPPWVQIVFSCLANIICCAALFMAEFRGGQHGR